MYFFDYLQFHQIEVAHTSNRAKTRMMFSFEQTSELLTTDYYIYIFLNYLNTPFLSAKVSYSDSVHYLKKYVFKRNRKKHNLLKLCVYLVDALYLLSLVTRLTMPNCQQKLE